MRYRHKKNVIDFDMLGRLRRYDTDSRESTFNYDGTKRLGDFNDGWKRYHWCKTQFLGPSQTSTGLLRHKHSK